MFVPYYECLKEHGHRMYQDRGSPVQKNLTQKDKAARKSCIGKRPTQPPQMDEETNPNYLDDYHHYITCLQEKGMPIHAIQPFGSGWTYNDGITKTHLSQEEKTKIDTQCKVAAFGD